MINVLFRRINYIYSLDKAISIIKIENPSMYRDILMNINNELLISIDDKEVDIEDKVLFIDNPFDLKINTKKFINALKKNIVKSLSQENEELYFKICEELSKWIYSISLNTDNKIEYNLNIDKEDLLDVLEVKYDESIGCSYLELLLSYIKVNIECFNYKIIVSNNLLKNLTNEEIQLFQKELLLKDLILLDIQNEVKVNHGNTIIVDDDLCVI